VLILCTIVLDSFARVMYDPLVAYAYLNPYKSSYLAAVQELEQRKSELTFVTLRIQQLQETIKSLEPLANQDGIAPSGGLSELCAQILISLGSVGVTAEDVMNALAYRGVDMSGYSNPLATLHTTLTRLCKPGSGFVKGRTPIGKPMYAYDPNAQRPIPGYAGAKFRFK
jgi:hypothetical protein